MAGEIIAVGSDVKNWKSGQRICANFALDHVFGDSTPAIAATHLGGGGYDGILAEYRILPAHSLVEVPDYLSYEEASTLPCAAVTAYNYLLGAKPLKGGDYVPILGTGGVSVPALQIAVALGATAIVTSSSDEKLEVVKKLGAHHIINHNKNKDWEKEPSKITGGRGVDHVIKIGGAATLSKSIAAVRDSGYGVKTISTQELVSSIIFKGVILRGIQNCCSIRGHDQTLIAKQIKPVVDKVFGFVDALAAYGYFETQAHVGKVIIR